MLTCTTAIMLCPSMKQLFPNDMRYASVAVCRTLCEANTAVQHENSTHYKDSQRKYLVNQTEVARLSKEIFHGSATTTELAS